MRALSDNGSNAPSGGSSTASPIQTSAALPDIKPQTEIAQLDRARAREITGSFDVEAVAPIVGMSPAFIRKVVGKRTLNADDVLTLLDQDAFGETVVRRSQVLDYLAKQKSDWSSAPSEADPSSYALHLGNVLDVLARLRSASIQCVVTSTPYWGLRIYEEPHFVQWADGERCPYGHEQTPEGFLRHTSEILLALKPLLKSDASVWWNVMDSFNTRTQIRSSAVEALNAMQGKDGRAWADHACRRYSAGHAYLKDGEQCMIPARVAERASRLGYFVKSIITWAKPGTTPEPQNSRVSRSLEYVLHLSVTRAPKFDKRAYLELPTRLGGRNAPHESAKLSDVWTLPTSNGGDGHGAQFPQALPGRCIGLSTSPDDIVLDPFVGSGNAGLAARLMGRRFVGVDVASTYLETARRRLESAGKADS